MSTTFTPTYQEFKVIAADFFREVKTMNGDELENAMKCLGLNYLGIQFTDDFFGRLHMEVEAPTIMRMATKAMFERECQIAVGGACQN